MENLLLLVPLSNSQTQPVKLDSNWPAYNTLSMLKFHSRLNTYMTGGSADRLMQFNTGLILLWPTRNDVCHFLPPATEGYMHSR